MTIAIILALALVAVLVIASTKPNELSIRREVDIKAPPDRIFALINDFHNWPAWAPQDKSDPTMKRTFSGNPSGKGAVSEWTGKGRAGSGRMEITESTVPSKITVKVDFARPFEAHNVNEFTLEPGADSTRVVWSMRGTNPFIAKAMSLFVNMDRMMGAHFEQGLQSLKTLCEGAPVKAPA